MSLNEYSSEREIPRHACFAILLFASNVTVFSPIFLPPQDVGEPK
jgi:hypothetical protein